MKTKTTNLSEKMYKQIFMTFVLAKLPSMIPKAKDKGEKQTNWTSSKLKNCLYFKEYYQKSKKTTQRIR